MTNKPRVPSLGGNRKKLKGLPQLGRDRATLQAIAALDSEDPGEVERAVQALQKTDDVRSLGGLRQILRERCPRDWSLGCDVVEALGAIGAPALPDLTDVLKSQRFDTIVRAQAGAALARIHDPSASLAVRDSVLTHVGEDDQEAHDFVPFLLQSVLNDGDNMELQLEILLSLYHTPNLAANLRVHSIVALGKFATDEVFDILCSNLESPSLWSRKAALAAFALSGFGSRAIPALESIYHHPFDGLPDTELQRATVFATGFPDTGFVDIARRFIQAVGLEFVFEQHSVPGLEFAGLLQPDCVYVSWVIMPELSGFEVVYQCNKLIPGVRTILFSASMHSEGVAAVQAAGVSRVIPAPSGPEEFLSAFRELGSKPDPQHVRRLADRVLSHCHGRDP